MNHLQAVAEALNGAFTLVLQQIRHPPLVEVEQVQGGRQKEEEEEQQEEEEEEPYGAEPVPARVVAVPMRVLPARVRVVPAPEGVLAQRQQQSKFKLLIKLNRLLYHMV